MKPSCIIFLIAVLFAPAALGQDTLRLEPSPSMQRSGGPDEEIQKEDRVSVKQEDLPSAMMDLMDRDDKYSGWRSGTFFFEKNTDQFLIHIIQDNATETFRFDREGNPLMSDKPVDTRD